MNNLGSKLILLITLGSISLWPCLAQSQLPSISLLPSDPEKNWTVALCQLKTINVSASNVYLANSIPLQLKERLAGCQTHRFSQDEIIVYKSAILAQELKKVIESLAQLQKKRDEDILAARKDFQVAKIKEDFEKNSQRLRERLQFLRELDPALIQFPDEKMVQFKELSGRLFPPPPFSALRYSEELDTNLLIWGVLEEIQGYLYCEIFFFDRVLQKDVYQIREAASPEEIFELVVAKLDAAREVLLGRAWANLIISVEPNYAFIKLKEKLIGLGTAELRLVEPNVYTLEISAPGYQTIEETISLAAGEEKLLELKLEKKEIAYLLIQSKPSGAFVYLNSEYQGTTPLVLDKPQLVSQLELKLKDYQDLRFKVGPETPELLSFSLIKSEYDFSAFKAQRRERFYTSLATFILSLPFPIFSYYLALDFALAQKVAEWEFFSVSYYYTFFISGALLVNCLVDLLYYALSFEREF